jgi:hypothetical protein
MTLSKAGLNDLGLGHGKKPDYLAAAQLLRSYLTT